MCFSNHFHFNLGDVIKPKQQTKLFDVLKMFNIQVCFLYGMTECNLILGYPLLNIDESILPLGYPLPAYRCLLIDEKGQLISSTNNSIDIGQIHIAG